MTHQDPDHPKVEPQEADEIVSPENTEKLYGLKAIESDPPAGNPEEIDVSLPEDTDGVAEDNMFSETEEN
jgi:hypothetical protein